MKDIRIAAAVTRSTAFDNAGNTEKMQRVAEAGAEQGAALICFPEMNITGYANSPAVREAAEPVPGPSTEKLRRLAEQTGVGILAGLAEKGNNGHFFATHVFISETGELSAYRKVHIPPPETALFSPGDTVPVFEIRGLKFGIQLCFDAHFPELSTLMAQKGADVIFMPHASPRGTPDEKYRSWMRHLPARAYDNSLFVVACNPTGENERKVNFPGVALAIDPSGNLMERRLGEKEALMCVDLPARSLERVRNHRMRFFFPHRRPGLYAREHRRMSS